MARKLSPQQLLFIEEYMKDWNASAAAKRAGYADNNGHRIVTKLAPYILKKHHMQMEKIGLSRDNMALGLVQHMKRCIGEIPVKETVKLKAADGSEYLQEVEVRKWDANGYNKAMETLAKMYRLLDNKLEINVNKREMGVLVVPALKKDEEHEHEKDITPKHEAIEATPPLKFPPLFKDVEDVEIKEDDGKDNLAADARKSD
jgi:phage terminase small subunit